MRAFTSALLATTALISCFSAGRADPPTLPYVANNAALSQLPVSQFKSSGVMRMGFSSPGEPLTFSPSNSPCSFNSGNGDGGSQVKSADGKCWIANFGTNVPVSQFGASGSGASTLGTANSGSTLLTLTAPIDFANGQGIYVCGAGANQTASPVSTGIAAVQHGTTGGTSYTYKLISDDGKGGLAVPASVTVANGNATLSATNYVAVTWNIPAGSVSTHVFVQQGAGAWRYVGNTANNYYNDQGYTTPIPLWVPATPLSGAQADGLTTTISSGGGTTGLTLATNATNSVVGGCVVHEDHAAIQAAWNYISNVGSLFYTGGSGFAAFHTPSLTFGGNAWYNVAVGLTSTAGAIEWASNGGAIINAIGYSLTTLTETAADRIGLTNLTFTGGSHSLSLSNQNVDYTRYVFRNTKFVGVNDYPVITSGDYSASMDCYSCDFVDTNGGISHDFDELRFFGGWWEQTPYRTLAGRAFHPQTHKNSQFNASIAAGVMTVSAFTLGFPLAVGDNVNGAGVARGTFITSLGTGTGGTGTYNVSVSQSIASEAMFTTYYNQSDIAYGVTTVTGVSDGITKTAGLRWWDIYGTLNVHGMRGGGEYAGIPLVYVQSDISSSVVPQTHQGATVSVDGGSEFCGSPPDTISGCIVLNGIPKSISWHGTAGPDGQPIIKDNISGGFGSAVTSFLTASALTSATPFIRYDVEPSGARSAAWPPVGNLWPSAVDPYITTYPHNGTFTVSDGSGASLTFTTSDLVYQYNFNTCTILFLIQWPVTANGSVAQVNTTLPAGCKGATVGNPVLDMPIVGGGVTTAARVLSGTSNLQFVNSTTNNQLTNANLSGQIVLGTITYPTTIQ
jgi:hypothetical protein